MKFDSLRELLLRKTEDPILRTFIMSMKDEVFIDKVVESLQKMARPHASMGRGANAAITAFANQLTNKDIAMIRDALAHHISHHKAALKAGKRDVADMHLNKIVPLMHLIARAAPHSGGSLDIDYVPLEPWESNYTTLDRRPETGKLIEGTKGLGRRPKKSTGQSKYGISRSVPDYRYLEMPAHPGHPDMRNSPHRGGYPFEEIQVGDPIKIDNKQAYLHIRDVEPQDKFTPHPFDYHPIHAVADLKQDNLTLEHMKRFVDAMNKWHESEHHANWMNSLKERFTKDPEGFTKAGTVKPPHHFEGLPLHEVPPHTKIAHNFHNSEARRHSNVSTSSENFSHLPDELRSKLASNLKTKTSTSSGTHPDHQPSQQQASSQPSQGTPKTRSSLLEEHLAHLPSELVAKLKLKG